MEGSISEWVSQVGSQVLPWLAGVFVTSALNWIYNRSSRLHILVQRAKYAILNPDALWDLSVIIEPGLPDDVRAKVRDLLPRVAMFLDPEYRLEATDDSTYFLTAGPFRAEVTVQPEVVPGFDETVDEADALPLVRFDFLQLPVSYRRTLYLIDEKIGRLFERIVEPELLPRSKRFMLTVRFQGLNPFFSLYLRRLGKHGLAAFDIEFHLDDSRVRILQDRVALTSYSIGDLKKLSRTYLALTP